MRDSDTSGGRSQKWEAVQAITKIKWDAEAAEKGGFEYFMMKEIHGQSKAVQDILNSVIKGGFINLSNVEITEDKIKGFEQIYIVACGSAWHIGMVAQYVLKGMAGIPVCVETCIGVPLPQDAA